MGNTKRLAVVIGRFNPCHIFHVQTLLARAMEYDHVLVLLGSSLKARTWKDPLYWQDRRDLIQQTATELNLTPTSSTPTARIWYAPIKDYPYTDNRWLFQVQEVVESACKDLEDETYVDDEPDSMPMEEWEPILVGVDKDMSTFYLQMFPQWEQDVFEPEGGTTQYSATQVREALFEDRLSDVADMLTPGTMSWLLSWLSTNKGQALQASYLKAKSSRTVLAYTTQELNPMTGLMEDKLVEAPYSPIFHTVDSVVVWRGHILFIRRRSHPGKGLWALPGGFLNAHEWPRDGAVRERTEESRLKFYHKGSKRRLELHRDWCKSSHEFSHPGRSLRGRTITNAYYWVIPAEYEVEIEAADDADRAQWFSFYDAFKNMSYEIFEDHQHIAHHFVMATR
jgi:bifunctional NMN adenylyltransferase/nudix hydrolase